MRKAIELDDLNTDNLLYYADACFRYNMIGEALETYKKLAENDPMNPELWLDYSAVYAEEKDFSKAIEIILSGISYHPQNHDYYYRLSGYLAKKGRNKEAYENFETALKMNYQDSSRLFEFYPELIDDIHFLDLMERYL